MDTEKRDDTEEIEIWRPIPGYEGRYDASNLGRIKSKHRMIDDLSRAGKKRSRTHHEKILKPTIGSLARGQRKPYLYVMFFNKSKPSRYSIHFLVALSFYGPMPEHFDVVMHLDDDPQNNRLSNLRYGTQKDNMRDCASKGRLGITKEHLERIQKIANNNRSKAIRVTNLKSLEVRDFESMHQACRELGLIFTNVSRACSGKQKVHKGFTFKYT